MAVLSLLFARKDKVRIGVNASDEFLPIGAVELDASIRENHVAANQITRHPVEVGVDISDHIRRQPERVTITGIVTNHPITFGGGLLNPNRSGDAYDNFLTMVNSANLVSVVTTLRQYSNMAIETMTIPRDSRRGNSIEVTMDLVEIQTATVAQSVGVSDLGSQNTSAL